MNELLKRARDALDKAIDRAAPAEVIPMTELVEEIDAALTAAPDSAEPDDDVRRAADALLGTLWHLAYSGKRTHEENWQEMDHRFPQARWLHEALKAADVPDKTAEALTIGI